MLGCVREYSDGNFDQAIQLGFAGAIERERAWRASSRPRPGTSDPRRCRATPLTGP